MIRGEDDNRIIPKPSRAQHCDNPRKRIIHRFECTIVKGADLILLHVVKVLVIGGETGIFLKPKWARIRWLAEGPVVWPRGRVGEMRR